jgi:hypothetical protein
MARATCRQLQPIAELVVDLSDPQVSCSILSVNCESRNTNMNVRDFGDDIHLEGNKQQASKS